MFHPLRVSAIERITDDAVAVTFAVPPELRETFRHTPGQHLNVRYRADGEEIRRSYSICAPATEQQGDPVLRVGIRMVDGGAFSTYALKELAVGDQVEAMAPMGRFLLDPRPGHFAAIVGGSGITPVLSMAATLLAREPSARFCLIRSDRSAASTMFLDEVAELKDRYPDRFQLVTALSREEQAAGLPRAALTASGSPPCCPPCCRCPMWTAGSCAARSAWSEERRARCARSAPTGHASTRRSSTSPTRGRLRRRPPGWPCRRRAPSPRRSTGGRAAGRSRTANRCWTRCCGAARTPRMPARGSVRDLPCLPGLGRGADGPQLRPGTGGDRGRLRTGLPVAPRHPGSRSRLRPLTGRRQPAQGPPEEPRVSSPRAPGTTTLVVRRPGPGPPAAPSPQELDPPAGAGSARGSWIRPRESGLLPGAARGDAGGA